jgi:hypothetical protein
MEGGKFWGHLKIAGDCKNLFPPNTHVQNWANYMKKKYDMGGECLEQAPFGSSLLSAAEGMPRC